MTDIQFKMLLVGDSGVGKTSLLNRYTDNLFSYDTKSTIGVEYKKKTIQIQGNNVTTMIWDTAGQERFRAMASQYYKGAYGAIIVYDITKAESFRNIKEIWINEVKQHAIQEIKIMLVGNKLDLQEQRAVQISEVEQYCKENDILFLETSASNNENVEQAFQSLIKQIFDIKYEEIIINKKKEQLQEQQNIKIGDTKKKEKKSCC